MNVFAVEPGFLEIPNLVSLNIFAVGCIHNCNGCSNKQLQDFNNPSKWILDDTTFRKLLDKNIELIDSVCFLGGDPFCQKDRLLQLASIAQSEYHLYVCAYTGYEFEHVGVTAGQLDAIVDGKWTGISVTEPNSNQKIYVVVEDIWKNISYVEWTELNNNLINKVA